MNKQILYNEAATSSTITNVTPDTPPIVETGVKLVPKKRYVRAKLVSMNDIAAELARVYRGMKSGELDPNVGTKLTYVLSTLAKLRMDSEIEERLAALEERNY